jgi:hypothetical protein
VIVFNGYQAIFFFFIASEMQRTRVKIPSSLSLSLLRTPRSKRRHEEERRKKTKEQGRAALNSCARNFQLSAHILPGMHQNKIFESYILFYKIKSPARFIFFS